MGRSRGGLTTKIHALVDANGLPIALKLMPLRPMKDVAPPTYSTQWGDGDVLLADRAYDSDVLRINIAARDAWAKGKPMPNRKRRPTFGAFLYRYRNLVGLFIKQNRAVRIRRHAIRQARRQLPRLCPARLHPHMVAP